MKLRKISSLLLAFALIGSSLLAFAAPSEYCTRTDPHEHYYYVQEKRLSDPIERCDYCYNGTIRVYQTTYGPWVRIKDSQTLCAHGGAPAHNDYMQYRDVTKYFKCDNCNLNEYTWETTQTRTVCGYK